MPQADKGIAAGVIHGGTFNFQNITVHGALLSAEEVQRRELGYLSCVMAYCAGLEWLTLIGLDDNSNANPLKLDAVYTALLTHSSEEVKSEQSDTRQQQALSAVAVLNRDKRLVLTGDPGSGKSAFVNYLGLCLSGEILGQPFNLKTLTAPLPDDQGNPQTEDIQLEGKDETEQHELRQPWVHGGLIPLRIILRDFSVDEHFPAAHETGNTCHLMGFLQAWLKRIGHQAYIDILEQRLRDGKVLVMFDGLDEVPQAGDRRKQLVACIEGFAKSYADCRLLVTCRPYAYRDPQWQLRGFAVSHLAPFSRGQIIRFIQRWYSSLKTLDGEAAISRGNKLQAAVFERESLADMAKRPLLLSLIAYLDGYHYDLPERRAELYERLLELLVNRWEKKRFEAEDSEKAASLQQHSLAEFLKIGQDAIRKVLERLAFRAHVAQDAKQQDTADIAEKDLIYELFDEARRSNQKIDQTEICDYLRDRVGILYQRAGANDQCAVYTFPHRSFQEYLAAAYFRRGEKALFADYPKCRKWYDVAAKLGREDPDRWREVVVLSGGINALKDASSTWDLLDKLCPERHNRFDEPMAWGLRLAAEIMAESLNLRPDDLSDWELEVLERIRSALLQALTTPHLPAIERAAIGRYLAIIGDPRTEITKVEQMQFVPIPAGKFWMGKGEYDREGEEILSETPAGEYDLNYAYQMAKYPVTVAQFKQFVEASETKEAGFKLGNSLALLGAANTPVVYVSQAEAMQFCRWLTEYLHGKGKFLGSYITLPDEAEWEKAARGGLENNPEPQRRYPWGNEISDEHLNYQWSIGQVTTPGIYPQGASPYGCEDMAGNVWEWTRSERGDYPYPVVGTDAWQQRTDPNGDCAVCVLRGGALNSGQRLVRSSVRSSLWQDFRVSDFGFRCCVVPMTLTSETSGR